MTQPDQQVPAFQPHPEFAMHAQHEEIDRLRQQEQQLGDRVIYLRALALQMQAEAQQALAEKDKRIESLMLALQEARGDAASHVPGESGLVPNPGAQNGSEGFRGGADVWSNLDDPATAHPDTVTTGEYGPEPDEGREILRKMPEHVRVPQPDVQGLMDKARMANGDPVSTSQPGIPVDESWNDDMGGNGIAESDPDFDGIPDGANPTPDPFDLRVEANRE